MTDIPRFWTFNCLGAAGVSPAICGSLDKGGADLAQVQPSPFVNMLQLIQLHRKTCINDGSVTTGSTQGGSARGLGDTRNTL